MDHTFNVDKKLFIHTSILTTFEVLQKKQIECDIKRICKQKYNREGFEAVKLDRKIGKMCSSVYGDFSKMTGIDNSKVIDICFGYQ